MGHFSFSQHHIPTKKILSTPVYHPAFFHSPEHGQWLADMMHSDSKQITVTLQGYYRRHEHYIDKRPMRGFNPW